MRCGATACHLPQIGPFDVTWQPMTHSIPESQALVIRTTCVAPRKPVALTIGRVGTVFHTGDWKFDPSPLIGPSPDFVALQRCRPHACCERRHAAQAGRRERAGADWRLDKCAGGGMRVVHAALW